VGDSVIVVQDTGRKLTVFWIHSGERAWQNNIRGNSSTGPLIGGDAVYTASGGPDGRVYAFDLEAGRQTWDNRIGFIEGPIALTEGAVLAAARNGVVVSLDRESGDEIWRIRLPQRLFGGITLLDDRILVTSEDSLFALDLLSGETLETAAIPAPVRAPPAASGSFLVYTSPAGLIFALHRDSYAVAWSVDLDDASFGGATIARDTAFATSVSGRLWRVPLANPDGASFVDLDVPLRAPPTPISDGVLVGTLAGEVLRIQDSAEPRWSVRVDGPIEVAPVMDRGVLFVADGRGRIHTWH
jgi:outer membrane protein assembly factor BamB